MSCSWQLALIALVLALPGVAHAQAPGGPPAPEPVPVTVDLEDTPDEDETGPSDADIARKHYEDGQAAAKKGDWQAAYTSYRAAIAIKEDYETLGALGIAAHRLGKYSEAADDMTGYLQKAPATLSASLRAVAESLLEDARGRVGTLTIVAPVGAEVFVDHVIVGKAPLGREVFVEPGLREIQARLGEATAQEVVSVSKGAAEAVTLVFGVASKPAASAAPKKVVPGPAPGGEAEVPMSAGRQALLISGAGLAAGAALAGAILLGASRGKVAEEERLRRELVAAGLGNVCTGAAPDARCARVKEAGTAADALTNGGAWLLIGAGAAGVLTGIYALATHKPGGLPVEASVVISPRGGGGGLSVRW